MSKFFAAVSSFVRAVVSLALVTMFGIGGWFGYSAYQEHFQLDREVKQKTAELAEKAAHIDRLDKELAVKNRKIEQLDMAVRLLKVEHRLAEIVVLKQWTDEATKKEMTTFQFTEVDDNRVMLSKPKQYTIDGDVVHIDGYVIKYFDEFIETGDPLKGTSAFLFRRVYGEHQDPAAGFPIDTEGTQPAAYASRGSKMTDVEKEIWGNFWDYANNPEKAKKVGVQAAHGLANYIKLEKGKLYKIKFGSTGRLTTEVEELTTQPASRETL